MFNILNRELVKIEKKLLIDKKRLEARPRPEGRVIIQSSKDSPKYIYENNGKREYIKRGDEDFVIDLAQKTYDQDTIEDIDKALKTINRFSTSIQNLKIQTRYRKFAPSRQKITKPYIKTYEEAAKEWYERPWKTKGIKNIVNASQTNRGEWVRSKSEKIIADALYESGLAYKYEAEFELMDGNTIYPDFTILAPYSHQEIIWEHFGIMDDLNYSTDMVNRMNLLGEHGYTVGHNLVTTYEYRINPLKTQMVREIIEKSILKEF